MEARELPLRSSDGHVSGLLAVVPASPTASLLWLPAMGVAARHYLPFADALAARGIAVFVHEWRGNGSSSLRAGRHGDWNYHPLLTIDLPCSEAAVAATLPDVPRILGGHSLGGQLACCRLGLEPDSASALWLVASGSPYWRAFPAPMRYWLPMAYRFLPWLADRHGALPGKRIGFAGQEARGVIHDWSRSAISGRYATTGLGIDLDRALARAAPPVRAVSFDDDWLAPPGSLDFLLSKLSDAERRLFHLDSGALGVRADHFAWMKQPAAVVDALID
ncbi:alpha/beta hydrolase family protein [Montanilutibacter psychrotolerans]|uniref:Alpha/beta fold hydrolase n=1 Tax=Montanilutibacter psychrotolerans TaxID=1327343 RepID=A0A3M8T0T5_9GAMM|nr:alpha/beta fold hydrolase [Lysobacter psychrotolerans]RNF85134.1 alpha/beta fold hydrolase [Lysobacter psychrotolerans]